MENKLTEQAVQRILAEVEQDFDRMAARLKKSILKEYASLLGQDSRPKLKASKADKAECLCLIDWMVEQNYPAAKGMDMLDTMITRWFITDFRTICKKKGINDVLSDMAITTRVKKHGYDIVDAKHPLFKNKCRMFKRL